MSMSRLTDPKILMSQSNRTQVSPPTPRSRELFQRTPPMVQTLIRDVLREERDVQHMKTKSEIHVKIYEHIRRIIK
jgi:hypothetical protein